MKTVKSLLASMAIVSMASAPALAQSSVAKPVERVGAQIGKATGDKSELEGSSGMLIAVLAAAAVIAGIVIIADDDDDPTSP